MFWGHYRTQKHIVHDYDMESLTTSRLGMQTWNWKYITLHWQEKICLCKWKKSTFSHYSQAFNQTTILERPTDGRSCPALRYKYYMYKSNHAQPTKGSNWRIGNQENSTSSAESSFHCSNTIVNKISKSHFTRDILTCVLYPAPETKRKQNDWG